MESNKDIEFLDKIRSLKIKKSVVERKFELYKKLCDNGSNVIAIQYDASLDKFLVIHVPEGADYYVSEFVEHGRLSEEYRDANNPVLQEFATVSVELRRSLTQGTLRETLESAARAELEEYLGYLGETILYNHGSLYGNEANYFRILNEYVNFIRSNNNLNLETSKVSTFAARKKSTAFYGDEEMKALVKNDSNHNNKHMTVLESFNIQFDLWWMQYENLYYNNPYDNGEVRHCSKCEELSYSNDMY